MAEEQVAPFHDDSPTTSGGSQGVSMAEAWCEAHADEWALYKQWAAVLAQLDPVELARLTGEATDEDRREDEQRHARQSRAVDEWVRVMTSGSSPTTDMGNLFEAVDRARNPPPDDPNVN